jgi:opacity protein-like surface antigen
MALNRKKITMKQIFAITLGLSTMLASLFIPSLADASSWGSGSRSNSYTPSDQARVQRSAPTSYATKEPDHPFAPESHNVAFNLGQVFLTGDLGQKYADSIGFELQYTYGVSEIFALDASLGWSSHGVDPVKQPLNKTASLNMVSLRTGIRAHLSYFDKIIPYVGFGFGFYNISEDFGAATQGVSLAPTNNASNNSISALQFGMHVGPGVTLLLSKNMFFGSQITYSNIFTSTKEDNAGALRQVGGAYLGFMINGGMTF